MDFNNGNRKNVEVDKKQNVTKKKKQQNKKLMRDLESQILVRDGLFERQSLIGQFIINFLKYYK